MIFRVTHIRDGNVVSEEIHQGDAYHVTMGPDACVVTIMRDGQQQPTKVVLEKGDRGFVMNEAGQTIAHLPPRGTASRAQLRAGGES